MSKIYHFGVQFLLNIESKGWSYKKSYKNYKRAGAIKTICFNFLLKDIWKFDIKMCNEMLLLIGSFLL